MLSDTFMIQNIQLNSHYRSKRQLANHACTYHALVSCSYAATQNYTAEVSAVFSVVELRETLAGIINELHIVFFACKRLANEMGDTKLTMCLQQIAMSESTLLAGE